MIVHDCTYVHPCNWLSFLMLKIILNLFLTNLSYQYGKTFHQTNDSIIVYHVIWVDGESLQGLHYPQI